MVSVDLIENKLKQVFNPVHMDIEDTSGGCGAMFELVLVSHLFDGVPLLERHRMVNEALGDDINEIHALSMKTWTVAQWEKKKSHMGIQFRGASISAGEFGAVDENHALVNFPGKQGKDYMYPKPGSSFSYYSGKGMNTFRIPFRWERMQPNLAIHSLNPADIIPLKAAVEYATNTLDAFVILDPQNFARYQGQVIGSEFVTIAHFARFWSLLAKEFKSNPKVMFSLINEPYDIQQSKWIDTANAAVAAIRSSGASNTILLPGTRWTGGHSWTIEDKWGDSNANTILNVKDPLNNMIIEIHQYLDKDYSGESGECVSTRIGSQALSQVTAWLRANNVKGILAETGGSQSPECIKAIDDIIGFVESNSDAWVGWLWWGAGPWWGDYMFSIEPDSDRSDKPQMKVLEKYLQSLPQN